MPRVGVLIELKVAATSPGESVCILGDPAELGSWVPSAVDSNAGLRLGTSASLFPSWLMLQPVWFDLPAGVASFGLQYKYVLDRCSGGPGCTGRLQWEDGIPNRALEVPVEDGIIWLVSDARWDSAAQPPTLSKVTSADVRARWSHFYPEWMAAEQMPSPRLSLAPTANQGMLEDPKSSMESTLGTSEPAPGSPAGIPDCEVVAAIQAEIAQSELEIAVLRERLQNCADSCLAAPLAQGQQSPSGHAAVPCKSSSAGDADAVAELGAVLALRHQRFEQEQCAKQDVFELTPDGSRTCRRSWLDSCEDDSSLQVGILVCSSTKNLPAPNNQPQVGARAIAG